MRVEVTPTHDIRNFYLRYEVIPEGKEKSMLAGLGGPLALEMETSCYVDLSGNRHETGHIKVAIWPYPYEAPRNLGQTRFYDTDSRRRFWVNLQDAVGTKVVDFLYDTKPGSVPKDGVTLAVPEGTRRATSEPSPAPAPAAPASTT